MDATALNNTKLGIASYLRLSDGAVQVHITHESKLPAWTRRCLLAELYQMCCSLENSTVTGSS